ncbi:hypothetical protein H5410_022070 [Solanum commersonii]|uniref:Uncharacterized protein n=1 Tax=Solanum commersonii TaxID=4109 RepID=A0A9J5ZEC5_SOLCO|nr:hypothetical protein H5410_022070 [Solanum commersonii]
MVDVSQDQSRALDMIQNDPELSSLMLVQAPLVDVEIRGAHARASVGERPMTSTSTTIPTFTPSTLEAMRAHGVESAEFIETA